MANLFNIKEIIAYTGSLIQQSHRETLDYHGYLRWSLEKTQRFCKKLKY